jgi:hypothetical protein
MELFAQLTKVDEEKRLVFGRAVDEAPDRSGEVFDYASSKPHFERWSNETKEASDGKSLGNLRAMHGKVAAGRLIGIDFDDAQRAVDVVAHVVDNNEWEKVLTGCYTGFSIGGSYVKKWDDPAAKSDDNKPLKRYTAAPNELSLVDRPCIPTAKFFDVQKSDGSMEKREFSQKQRDKLAGEGKAMKDGSYPIANESDLHNAITAVGRAKDPEAAKKHIKERAKAMGMTSALPDDWKDKEEKMDEPQVTKTDEPASPPEYVVEGTDAEVAALAKTMGDEHLAMKDVLASVQSTVDARKREAQIANERGFIDKLIGDGKMKKSMYTVAQLAQVLAQVSSIRQQVAAEEAAEKDAASGLPLRMLDLVGLMGDVLKDMVSEEVAELLPSEIDENGNTPDALVTTMEADSAPKVFAMADTFRELRKVGRRNSTADESRIQKIHDMAVELHSGCCKGSKMDELKDDPKTGKKNVEVEEDPNKLAAVGDLQKAFEEQQTLTKTLLERIAKLESQPAPAKAILRAVSKSQDTGATTEEAAQQIQPVVKGGEVNDAATEIKKIHQGGGRHILKM